MQELTIGGATFRVEYRTADTDYGPAIRVFADVEGEPRQVLRFDCFADDPHYHYDPTGVNKMFHLDEMTMGCSIEFSLRQIAENTQAMINKAGFAATAESIDQSQIANRIGDIKALIEDVTAAANS